MPLYRVLCQQYVEQIAEIEVEAATPAEARQTVLDNDLMVDAVWRGSDDAYEPDIYAVAEGTKLVWERGVSDEETGEIDAVDIAEGGDGKVYDV